MTGPQSVRTVGEVALELRCSVYTVRRLLERGELRGVKRGGRWYIRQSAVDVFLDPDEETPGERLTAVSPPGRR